MEDYSARIEQAFMNGATPFELLLSYTEGGEEDQFSVVLPEEIAKNTAVAMEIAENRAKKYIVEDEDSFEIIDLSSPTEVQERLPEDYMEA